MVEPARNPLYAYDPVEQKAVNEAHPWRNDPHYFKHVRISAVALLKMVMHARSGGSIEVMGLMQGKIQGDTFVVMDAIRLPVEGTETRVNAGAAADEYQVNYLQACRDNDKLDNAIGWYHSHPGYGCWLSGIDVGTQVLQQTFSDPYLAVVVDPDRTISAGKVEIGAFRTFPDDYKPPTSETDDGYQAIPLNKVEDFGAHASRYYSLEVSHFKSTTDAKLLSTLWKKYWMGTLSQSPLFSNRNYVTKQMADLSQKIRNGEKSATTGRGMLQLRSGTNGAGNKDGHLEKAVRDSKKIAQEQENGLLASQVKQKLFNGLGEGTRVVEIDPEAMEES